MKEDEGGANGEWEDEAPGDLVEGSVDVFQSVVGEAVKPLIPFHTYKTSN